MMTLRNFAAAGLDMKNKGDYEYTASQCVRLPSLDFHQPLVERLSDICCLISGPPPDGALWWQHQQSARCPAHGLERRSSSCRLAEVVEAGSVWREQDSRQRARFVLEAVFGRT